MVLILAGLLGRLDHHSNIELFTPRLHIRFVPIDDIVIRLSGGAGRKVANIFAENQNYFPLLER